MKNLIAERIVFKGSNRIVLRFPYDEKLNAVVKELPDVRWSTQLQSWHIADTPDIIYLLLKSFYGKAYVDYSSLRPSFADKVWEKRDLQQTKNSDLKRASTFLDLPFLSEKGKEDVGKFRRWMEVNRYSEATILTYTSMVSNFLRFLSPKTPQECSADDLTRIVEEYILPNGLSHSFQNQMISAVKKFFRSIYKSVIDPGTFTRPRPRYRLPGVLSKEDIKLILNILTNEKHRVMLSLIYACGLRRSELIQLMPTDIDRNRKLLRIRQSKGFKDRVVPVSDRTVGMVETYLMRYKPKKYLFEGQWPGEPYSASSLEKVLKGACERAGIQRGVSLHWLRHSYATHLLESGTDLRYIQELLGHKSSRTTEIYTHVTTKSIQKIRSPFDDL